MKIYIGNVPFSADDVALEELFKQFGQVDSAKVITDRDSGRSRGFAFVEMANDEEARKAIEDLNGKEFQGRALTVNEARPRESRGGGGRGGGGGGGRRGGGDGGGGGNRW